MIFQQNKLPKLFTLDSTYIVTAVAIESI